MKMTLLLLLGLVLNSHAMAEIYEVVDEHGNKTYTNTLPPDPSTINATRLEQNKTNIWQGEENQEQLNEEYFQELTKQEEEKAAAEAEQKKIRRAAKQRLDEARQAYEEAKVLKQGDYYRNKNGGIREKPEFKQRVEAAKKELDEAQQYYDSVN